MGKLKIEDLKKIKEKHRYAATVREGSHRAKITVHMGTCGIAAGARGILSALIDEIARMNIQDVILTNSGCAGLCSREPMITVELRGKPPVKYIELTPEKAVEILEKHVQGGRIVKEYVLAIGSETTH